MSTSRAVIVECLKAVPGGLTAREVAEALRVPVYQARGTLCKLATYNRISRVKTEGRYHTFRYFVSQGTTA